MCVIKIICTHCSRICFPAGGHKWRATTARAKENEILASPVIAFTASRPVDGIKSVKNSHGTL